MLVEGKPDGQNLKVLDFGIAKMVQDEASPELTGQGDLVGTPFYMSPEQIQGGVGKDGRGELDGRSDLYSVGVLLYQLLTGALPFSAKSKMEVLVAHLYQKPRPMSEANPKVEVPPQVERLVMSCLERDPDLRPHSARELAERFRAAIGDIPRPRAEPRPRRVRTGGPAATALVVVAVLMVGALGVVFALRRPGPGPIPPGSGTAGPDRPPRTGRGPPEIVGNPRRPPPRPPGHPRTTSRSRPRISSPSPWTGARRSRREDRPRIWGMRPRA